MGTLKCHLVGWLLLSIGGLPLLGFSCFWNYSSLNRNFWIPCEDTLEISQLLSYLRGQTDKENSRYKSFKACNPKNWTLFASCAIGECFFSIYDNFKRSCIDGRDRSQFKLTFKRICTMLGEELQIWHHFQEVMRHVKREIKTCIDFQWVMYWVILINF